MVSVVNILMGGISPLINIFSQKYVVQADQSLSYARQENPMISRCLLDIYYIINVDEIVPVQAQILYISISERSSLLLQFHPLISVM